MRSYFDEAIFPVAQTMVVRCEDFLFHFDDVMRALHRRGVFGKLQDGSLPECLTPVLVGVAKTARHAVNSRASATEFYAKPDNRYIGFTEEQVGRLLQVDQVAAGLLGYRQCSHAAVSSWLQRHIGCERADGTNDVTSPLVGDWELDVSGESMALRISMPGDGGVSVDVTFPDHRSATGYLSLREDRCFYARLTYVGCGEQAYGELRVRPLPWIDQRSRGVASCVVSGMPKDEEVWAFEAVARNTMQCTCPGPWQCPAMLPSAAEVLLP